MLPKDLRAFIELFNSNGVEYVIVGAFALAFHGRPRYTGDIDFLIHSTTENATKVLNALTKFGFGALGLTIGDFLRENSIVQLGYPPNRIDLITSLSGVTWEAVWNGRVHGDIDGMPVVFIGRNELVVNKRATGRPQDKADLDALG